MKKIISTILCVTCFSSLTVQASNHEFPSQSIPKDTTDFSYHHQIKKKDSYLIYAAANEAAKIGQDYTGLTNTFFYAISSPLKTQTAIAYDENITQKIAAINKNIRSLGKHAKAPANFITGTLTQLNQAIIQLIIDSSQNASLAVLNTDYANIQSIVDAFDSGFANTLHENQSEEKVCKSIHEAKEHLGKFVRDLELYITQNNLLIYQSYIGSETIIESNYTFVSNLRNFVKASAIATYLSITK